MAASLSGAGLVRSMPLFEGDVFLGDVDVFLPPGSPPSGMESQHPVFPSNRIRISRRSPASDRYPPLAVLQVISAYSMRCKIRATKLDLHHPRSLLGRLYSSCLEQRMVCASC
jgi:RNA polymerase II C-terminal domain phosphatase-like 1/2